MLILTELMFIQVMRWQQPLAFSEEALKLIYRHHAQNNVSQVEFRVYDIAMMFEEESYFDCVENNDIPVESLGKLRKASSDFEKTEIVKNAISGFLESKGVLVGFTSNHTVVYESRR